MPKKNFRTLKTKVPAYSVIYEWNKLGHLIVTIPFGYDNHPDLRRNVEKELFMEEI